MAESPIPAKFKLLATKTVQELTEGELLVPPQKYILKDEIPLPDASVKLMDVPVIDLGLLTPSSISMQEFDKLKSALTNWGCFQVRIQTQLEKLLEVRSATKFCEEGRLCMYNMSKPAYCVFRVINHGMTPGFLDKVREIRKQFFAMPKEEKQKYLRPVDKIEGYGNDTVFSEQQILDWNDRLFLTVYPQDQRKLKFWPENPKSFRPSKLQVVTETVLKAMARSLNLEEDCFLDKYGEERKMDARFNFYPPCSRPDRVLGIKPHADGTIITLLLQDKEVEGLQFMKDDQWFRAPIVPEALLVNVGDLAEISSNGLFKSPVHKVVTNAKKERISVAAFCVPDAEKEIEPFEKLINESRPRLYRKVKDYVGIYFQYYQQGRRPIETALI